MGQKQTMHSTRKLMMETQEMSEMIVVCVLCLLLNSRYMTDGKHGVLEIPLMGSTVQLYLMSPALAARCRGCM